MLLRNNRAFTLIELLVVVLIIGILSAIALPQYTQAVEKSRAAEALSNIGSFSRAVQIWKLGNPDKSRNFTGGYGDGELDIGIPDDWSDNGWSACSKNFCYHIDTKGVDAPELIVLLMNMRLTIGLKTTPMYVMHIPLLI